MFFLLLLKFDSALMFSVNLWNSYDIVDIWRKKVPFILLQLHCDLNDQNLLHSTIGAPPGVSKNPEDQIEVHSGELER